MSQPRIRKSLAALIGSDERKGYFYCLKLLGVLPPPPKSGFDQWVFYPPPAAYTGQWGKNMLYRPKCLHDVLISSHVTSCEHHSLYFAFYHRNLMILTQLFLNFAHEVLRGGFSKLQSIYPSSDYEFLYNKNNKQKWVDTFNAYNALKGIPEQVANHYWNPTDYPNDLDLSLPEEISPKANPTEPIDLLFFDINGSYPWEISAKRRWFNTPEEYSGQLVTSGVIAGNTQNETVPVSGQVVNYNYKQPVIYGQHQKEFIAGKLDPRKHPNVYGENMLFLAQWLDYNNFNQVFHRIYKAFDPQVGNVLSNAITHDESLANYGAKSKNVQYITQEQRIEYNLTPSYIENYNMLIPHFQYANALFQTDIKTFFGNYHIGVELSHDTMHDNFQYFMDDVTFSVTSFVFWPYHSWIDVQIEAYIRRANAQAQAQKSPFTVLSKILNSDKNPLPGLLQQVIVTNVGEVIQKQQNWNISGGPLEPDAVGYYPIVEYISPLVREDQADVFTKVSAAFNARDYIITKDKIRTSFDFDIYQDYYIKDLHLSRYYFLNDVTKFNFNYNYQIGSKPQDLDNILDINATNIPTYLQNMQDYWKPTQQLRLNALRTASNFSVKSKAHLVEKPGQHEALVSHQDLAVKKLFQSGVRVFATYPPDTKNGANLVFLKLKNFLSKFNAKHKPSEKELQYLEKAISQGILVGNIHIFGKEKFAKVCNKCITDKVRFYQLDQNLRVRVPLIWKFLHLESLNQVLYDSKNPNQKIKSLNDYLELVPNKKFKEYRLLSGAQEVEIESVATFKTQQSPFIRIDVESYSIRQNTINSIASKKFYNLNSKFDFYKTYDVNNNNQNSFFDQFIYKRIKGWISVGTTRIDFAFDIPSFQRLLRLKIIISQEQKGFSVAVQDADYGTKKEYFDTYEA